MNCCSEFKVALILLLGLFSSELMKAQVVGKDTLLNDTLPGGMMKEEQNLSEVTVTAVVRKNTEAAAIQLARKSNVIETNISAQEILKTQDSNVGEVLRRVPGVSLIDGRFVMVRGLAERYNNVWMNGGAVPSSEADTRAFSFDIVPSSQIDNISITKTPVAEYPADYTGGFIIVDTKEIPSENFFDISLGTNFNTATSFHDYKYYKGSPTDFLGFDNGKRQLRDGMEMVFTGFPDVAKSVDLLRNNFDNDWHVYSKKPVGDLRFSSGFGRRWRQNGHQLGMTASLNYSSSTRTYTDMTNNLFGLYDVLKDQSSYFRQATDDQYNRFARIGTLLNFTYLSPSGKSKYQLKNLFNQIGTKRYTRRRAIGAQLDKQNSAEYYYQSRMIYVAQLIGKHSMRENSLDWNLGYAFSNRVIPDRKRYMLTDQGSEIDQIELYSGNNLERQWTDLNENTVSASVNDKQILEFSNWKPELKFGAYGEYRYRNYLTRDLFYQWHPQQHAKLPDNFRTMPIEDLLSEEQYMGADGIYMLEDRKRRNDYQGKRGVLAGYLSALLPIGRLSVLAGLRYEHDYLELISNTRDDIKSELSHTYHDGRFYPSVNATYKFSDRHQLRLSYGNSVNRQEFREIAPSQYYDFDKDAAIQGNADLRTSHITNVDLRYEFYPGYSEMVSLALFYKYFDSPIEWTYTLSGGTDVIYSFQNAKSAGSYGIELDFKKKLDFIGLKYFSWSFNGALIRSKVDFEKGGNQPNRPMQGQSPYLVNTGLFYNNYRVGLDIAVLYNRIGRRIVGVGITEGSEPGDTNSRVPDSYEMPRDMLDVSLSKSFGQHWKVKFNVKDLFAQNIRYIEFVHATFPDGTTRDIEQTVREYRPGRNFGLSAVYNF